MYFICCDWQDLKNMCAWSLSTAFDMDRETEIAAKITQNSRFSFVLQEQNFPYPRLAFCVNVSHIIRKIWGNFKG